MPISTFYEHLTLVDHLPVAEDVRQCILWPNAVENFCLPKMSKPTLEQIGLNQQPGKRLRTWLFLASLLAAVLGPLAVSAANRMLDARFQANHPISPLPTPEGIVSQATCIPSLDQDAMIALEKINVNEDTALTLSARIAELFAADQAVRLLPDESDPQAINAGDAERRLAILDYILNGEIQSPRDLVYAAYIFQHGDCPEHYAYAHRLAQLALQAGYAQARWIYAATLDRYLMSLDKPQKYGTQYTWINGAYSLYPIDPATTDAERAEYNVPPLKEIMQRVPQGMAGGSVRRQWLESWWLTLLCAGFAVLSMLIALFDGAPNARRGRLTLVIALLFYPISVLGHYEQMLALSSGTTESQTVPWNVLNVLLIIVWIGCAVNFLLIHPLRRIRQDA